jgi:hypothetical protein
MHFTLAAKKAFVIAANSESNSTFFLIGFLSLEFFSLDIISSYMLMLPVGFFINVLVAKLETLVFLL